MTTATPDNLIDVDELAPLGRSEGIDLGREAYRRLIDELRGLQPEEWQRQTDCTDWDVRSMAGHVAGMMWSMSRLRRTIPEQARSAKRAKANGTDPTDEMTAIQVERMQDLTTDELLATMDGLVDEVIAGRRRVPDPLADRMKFGVQVGGVEEPWALSYLTGAILTRDTWLHRVADLAGAVGRDAVLDADHDGRIVADVVAEWCRRHGKPVELILSGPAGGRFRQGTGGPTIETDPVAFARMTSGRAQPTHALLATEVPY